jgi:hypothetical protein
MRDARQLPHGSERDLLIRKARQLQTASEINQWLASPELNPPKQDRYGRPAGPLTM